MFKRYDDASHWGLFIPIGRKKLLRMWDLSMDEPLPPANYRMHFIVTVKLDRMPTLRMHEWRVRMGFQYL
jgi:hypothetical protein